MYMYIDICMYIYNGAHREREVSGRPLRHAGARAAEVGRQLVAVDEREERRLPRVGGRGRRSRSWRLFQRGGRASLVRRAKNDRYPSSFDDALRPSPWDTWLTPLDRLLARGGVRGRSISTTRGPRRTRSTRNDVPRDRGSDPRAAVHAFRSGPSISRRESVTSLWVLWDAIVTTT